MAKGRPSEGGLGVSTATRAGCGRRRDAQSVSLPPRTCDVRHELPPPVTAPEGAVDLSGALRSAVVLTGAIGGLGRPRSPGGWLGRPRCGRASLADVDG